MRKTPKRIRVIEDVKIQETLYLEDFQIQNGFRLSQTEKYVYFTLLHHAGDNEFRPFRFSFSKSKHYLTEINQKQFERICQKLKQYTIIDFTKPIDQEHSPVFKLNLLSRKK